MSATLIHTDLTPERWGTFSLAFQLANVGSEVGRALKAKQRQDAPALNRALERALELLDLTIVDPKHRLRLRELCRLREVVCDFFVGSNEYGSTDASMDNYFLAFNIAAAQERHGQSKKRRD